MKKLLRLSSIGFYILMLFTFFIIGLYFAEFIGAGKNQGLAGGAILLGYGVLFAGIAFFASFFIAYYVETKSLRKINWVLLTLLLIACGKKYYEFKQRDALQQEQNKPYQQNPKQERKVTAPVSALPTATNLFKRIRKPEIDAEQYNDSNIMGLGYFSPNFYENNVLYFYGNLNLEKSITEHSPHDSITFKRNKHNVFEIATAPPWLVPDMLKLDYDMLYFKIVSVSQEFAEVVVNATTNQTSFVDRRSGDIAYWPDFLMSVHSVEFIDSKERVKVRDFEESGDVNTSFAFMKPVKVKDDWMYVFLLDGEFNNVGKGWIQWKRDGKLLILYNLLS